MPAQAGALCQRVVPHMAEQTAVIQGQIDPRVRRVQVQQLLLVLRQRVGAELRHEQYMAPIRQLHTAQ